MSDFANSKSMVIFTNDLGDYMSDSNTFTFIATIIAVYVGHLLTKKRWKYQIDYQKENIARGFYYEIETLENIIDPIVKNDTPTNFTAGHPDLLHTVINQVIEKTNVEINKTSLYHNYGLYFIFYKEIYSYDGELTDNLLKFYKNFLQADECYKIYMKSTDSNEKYKKQDCFFDYLKKANSSIPSLKKSLKRYFKSL